MDARTALFVCVAMCAVSVAIIAVLFLGQRRRVDGIGAWLACYVAHLVAITAVAARGALPDAVSILLGTPVAVASTCALHVGLLRFAGDGRRVLARHVALTAATLAAIFVFGIPHPSLVARTVVLALALSVAFGQCAWVMLRPPVSTDHPGARVVGGVCAAFLPVNAVRILVELRAEPATEFLRSGARAAAFLVTYELLTVALTFGLVLLVVGRYRRDLERHVDQRLELEAAMRKSDRLVAVGRLAEGAAHEINNPLAYVLGNLDFVLEEAARDPGAPIGEDRLAALRDARDGADRIRRVIAALRAHSADDEHEVALLSVDAAVEAAVETTTGATRGRARVACDLGAPPPVRGSEASIVQVFRNLILNAAAAMPEARADEHAITIRTAVDDHGRVVVEIRDDGAGMADEVLAHAFDPFHTTRPVGQALGLGLFFCQNVVRRMGGDITVESRVGVGSTVRVTLPAAAS